MYKNILFDIDGTIVDTEKQIIQALQKVLKEELNIVKEYDELLFVLGTPGFNSLKKFNLPDDIFDDILYKWSTNIGLLASEMTVFPEIEDIISNLYKNNLNLGIITSKDDRELKTEFTPLNLNKYFKTIITASDTKLHKPNPDPIFKAMDNLNINAEKTIYIGDSIYDMQSAKSAGISFALAKWGAPTLEGFDNVDYILEKPKDILKLI